MSLEMTLMATCRDALTRAKYMPNLEASPYQTTLCHANHSCNAWVLFHDKGVFSHACAQKHFNVSNLILGSPCVNSGWMSLFFTLGKSFVEVVPKLRGQANSRRMLSLKIHSNLLQTHTWLGLVVST